jgi:small subunit ribosomal protein S8
MTDPISDMIIRIQNGGAAQKETVLIPYSKLKFEICTLLQNHGYLKSVTKKGKKVAKFVEVELIYDGRTPKIIGVKRVSKPSRRVYQQVSDIRKVKNGYGDSIISTPKGVLTGADARKEKVGGEVLFNIW